MKLSASEFYEAGLALPPSVREDVARRLLESVDEAWTAEIGSRVDGLTSGKVHTIPGEEVFARSADRLDAPTIPRLGPAGRVGTAHRSSAPSQ